MISVSLIDRALILLVVADLAVFGLYWFDKRQARHHGWRVREGALLLASLFGGLGAWTAQHLLRHKTRKEPFRSLLGLTIIAHMVGVAALFRVLLT